MKYKITPGQKFNRLTVVQRTYGRNRTTVLFKCECGTEKDLEYWMVVRGTTKSCGCLRQDILDKKLRVRHKGEPVNYLRV